MPARIFAAPSLPEYHQQGVPAALLSRVAVSVLLLAGAPAAASPEIGRLGERVERWVREQGIRPLRRDPALAAVALENSRAVAELDGLERRGVTEHLRFLLERNQVRDAVVLALSGRFADPQELWLRLRAYLAEHLIGAALTHYGLGLSAAERGAPLALTLVLLRRRVEVKSLRAVRGQPLRLCGVLAGGGELRVLVTTPAGQVREARPRARGGHFCARLGRADKGRHQLELMVEGPFGPEVAALFPVYVDEAPPSLPVEKIYPPATLSPRLAEQELLRLLDQSRAAAGLPPLQVAEELRRASRQHSLEMLERGFFGHRSPWRGSLSRRLAAEGLSYLKASENLVLTTSAERAHDALLASPAHRRNLLDPALTHVGIGVAVDAGRGLLYVTQCFARLF